MSRAEQVLRDWFGSGLEMEDDQWEQAALDVIAAAAAPDVDVLAQALEAIALTDMWDHDPQPDGSIIASLNRHRMAAALRDHYTCLMRERQS